MVNMFQNLPLGDSLTPIYTTRLGFIKFSYQTLVSNYMISWLISTKLYHQVAYQFQILQPQRHLLSIIWTPWKIGDDEVLSQV